jgi:uncharacterized protein YijF (DUF1287 family)
MGGAAAFWWARRPSHIGIIATPGGSGATVAHNIGAGAEESSLAAFAPHRAVAHYRWPAEMAP